MPKKQTPSRAPAGLRHTVLGWGVRTPRTRRRTAAPAERLPPGIWVVGDGQRPAIHRLQQCRRRPPKRDPRASATPLIHDAPDRPQPPMPRRHATPATQRPANPPPAGKIPSTARRRQRGIHPDGESKTETKGGEAPRDQPRKGREDRTDSAREGGRRSPFLRCRRAKRAGRNHHQSRCNRRSGREEEENRPRRSPPIGQGTGTTRRPQLTAARGRPRRGRRVVDPCLHIYSPTTAGAESCAHTLPCPKVTEGGRF